MSDKKNIDRLFQEKFKDFEAAPDPQVWVNIEAALREKKRRIIPFWLRLSGVAAALFFGILAVNHFNFTAVSPIKTSVVEQSAPVADSLSNKNQIQKTVLSVPTQQQLVITNPKTVSNHEKETTNSASQTANQQTHPQTAVALYQSKNNSPLKTISATDNHSPTGTTAVAQTAIEKESKTTLASTKDNSIATPAVSQKQTVALTTNTKEEKVVPTPTNELEELLKKKQEKTNVVAQIAHKWQVVPTVAPVYLNASASGSAIDQQFANNTKTAETNLSFGIGLHYAITKKLRLRTGVNKLSLDYNTNDVGYSTSLMANNLENIAYSSSSAIEVKNQDQMSISQGNVDLAAISRTATGVINQKMGYYEVPVELSYALLNKKFGINLIGGFSTFFLSENKIALRSSTTDFTLGEAKNLNDVHFSTNLGLGFKYQIVKAFQINLEPMVKYQLNTFTGSSSSYKPVFIGLYSGVSYSF